MIFSMTSTLKAIARVRCQIEATSDFRYTAAPNVIVRLVRELKTASPLCRIRIEPISDDPENPIWRLTAWNVQV